MRYVHPIPDPNHYDAADPFYSDPGAKRHHLGSDYSVVRGTPLRAVASGVIYSVSRSSVLGWVTTLHTDDGLYWGYAHQDTRPSIAVGSRISCAEYGNETGQLATSGNSGTASQGDHLHLSAGTTPSAAFGEEPLIDPHAFIESHLTATAAEKITPFDEQEPEMIQPLNTRVIRNKGDGNLVMLYPSGIAIIGDPLIPDIAAADGQALMAGQPKNDDGHYWVDLEADRFGWELARHKALLEADTARLTQLISNLKGIAK